MRKNVFFIGVIMAALLSGLVLGGCDNSGIEGPLFNEPGSTGNSFDIQRGKLTINNLPYGYLVSRCDISSIQNPAWRMEYGRINPPNDLIWKPSIIGYGGRSGGGAANILELHRERYQMNNGVWESIWVQEPFNYTGSYGVYLDLTKATSTGNTTVSFGLNNVQFVDGKATIDWSVLASSAFAPIEGDG